MYEYLSGELVEKSPTSIILDVKGVGYHVSLSLSSFSSLPSLGQNVKILTHFVVREDAQALFGFVAEAERSLFRLLITISGIGPKLAMTVLSGIPTEELTRAIVEGKVNVLTGISGIGRKTAERIIVELREKLVIEKQPSTLSQLQGTAPAMAILEDSLQALVELGYRKQKASEAIKKAIHEGCVGTEPSVQDLIRASLKFV